MPGCSAGGNELGEMKAARGQASAELLFRDSSTPYFDLVIAFGHIFIEDVHTEEEADRGNSVSSFSLFLICLSTDDERALVYSP